MGGAIFYEGIKFGTVGLLEESLGGHFSFSGGDGTSKSEAIMRKTVFGALGGLAAGLLTYPNDTVRRLLQIQGSSGTETKYKGYIDCVIKVARDGGIGRFYRGVGVNLLRMAPNTAIQFGAYEFFKVRGGGGNKESRMSWDGTHRNDSRKRNNLFFPCVCHYVRKI